jgi:hypothetical protein
MAAYSSARFFALPNSFQQEKSAPQTDPDGPQIPVPESVWGAEFPKKTSIEINL